MRPPLLSLSGRRSGNNLFTLRTRASFRAFRINRIIPEHERTTVEPTSQQFPYKLLRPAATARPVQDEGSAADEATQPQAAQTSSQNGSEQSPPGDGGGTNLNESGGSGSSSNTRLKRVTEEEMMEEIKSHVFDGPIPSNVVHPMVNAIRAARGSGLPDKGPGYVAESHWEPATPQRPLRADFMQKQSTIMIKDLVKKRKDTKWIKNLHTRKDLPIMAEGRHKKLANALKECDVLIVPGSTGSGKSTQVPQIILDYAVHEGKGGYTNIICSQPRRISAVSVARRVAEERNEPLGQTVGYHVRFLDAPPRKYGSILYCTGGILWNYLHHRPNELLDNTTHILVDEVHERTVEIDLILMVLRKLIHERRAQGLKHPKLLLMSATLKSEDFVRYFSESVDGQPGLRVQTFEIPGRLFPIEETFLDDLLPTLRSNQLPAIKPLMDSHDTKSYVNQEISKPGEPTDEQIARDSYVPPDLVAAAVLQIFTTTVDEGGDILVFLPGMSDIEKTASLLEANRATLEKNRACKGVSIFKLHSSLSETNDSVFDEVPTGWRRIILASNIAETSITLGGVTHVIDTGTMKLVVQGSENGLRDLRCRWASRQSVQQRRGRAGRIRAGNYYALYSRARLDLFDVNVTPEIQRTDLTSAALSLKTMAKPVDIVSGLCRVPDRPVQREIDAAVKRLQRLGALTEDENVTPLGRTLSLYATKPAAAKALLLGVLFRCLEPMMIAAIAEDEPLDGRIQDGAAQLRSRYLFSEGSGSNSIAAYNAFKELRAAMTSGDSQREQKLATERGLRRSMYTFIGRSARQICGQLHSSGLADMGDMGDDVYPTIPPELNVNADCQPLIKVLLMLSLQPEMAVRWGKHTFYGGQGLLMPQFRSVNDAVSYQVHREQIGTRIPVRGDLVAYGHGRTVSDRKRQTMVDTTSVTPLMAVLFARSVEKTSDTQLKLDGAINLNIAALNDAPKLSLAQVLILAMEYRKMLNRFVEVAFSDLHPGRPSQDKPKDCNTMFAAEHELRGKITAGLVEVLKLDAAVESTVLAERYVRWEEADDRRLKAIEEVQAAKKLLKLGSSAAREADSQPDHQVTESDVAESGPTITYEDDENVANVQAATA